MGPVVCRASRSVLPVSSKAPAIALLLLSLAVCGCGSNRIAPQSLSASWLLSGEPLFAAISARHNPAPGTGQSLSLSGAVQAGSHPLTGSVVHLYEVTRSAESFDVQEVLPPVATDASGSFNQTQPANCAPSAELFAVAVGGVPVASSFAGNPAAEMAAALGPCTGLSNHVEVNISEITTIATVHFLAQSLGWYDSDPSSGVALHDGFYQDAGSARALAGLARGTLSLAGVMPGTLPVEKINSLANLLDSCELQDSVVCQQFLDLAQTSGTTQQIDPVTALMHIALHSAANVPAIYVLASAVKVHQPALAAPPSDWAIVLPSPLPGFPEAQSVAAGGSGGSPVSAKQSSAPAASPALHGQTAKAVNSSTGVAPALVPFLAGYWPLNEGAGTVAFDQSPNHRNGAWSGRQTGSQGFYSGASGTYAGAFDGATNLIDLGPATQYPAQAITLAAWVRQSSYGNASTWPIIVGNGAVSLYVNGGQAGLWAHIKAGSTDHYLSAQLPMNQWHMAVVTYDGTIATLYLDGNAISTQPASGPLANAGEESIGSGYWNGVIDGAGIYSVALSGAQVQALAHQGYAVPSPVSQLTAVAGDAAAAITFAEPASNGGSAITSYTIVAQPGGITTSATSAGATIVSGLKNGVSYRFSVTAINASGSSTAITSNAVTPKQATIAVAWNDLHQSIDGFGASDAFASSPALTADQADLFFSPTVGIGLSLLRTQVPNDGSCFSVGPACAGAVADIQSASARGARIWATPWSPPASLLSNGSTDCTAGPSPGALIASNYETYAGYLANYIRSVDAAAGVPLFALSIQNEPNFCASYGGAIWTGANLHDFVANNLGPEIADRGLTQTEIMLPESGMGSLLASLAGPTMSDPAAAQYVGLLAYHGYDNPASLNVTYPAVHVWETEMSGTAGSTLTLCNGCWDPSMDNALLWAGVINSNLVDLGVNAWHYWWLIDRVSADDEGLIGQNGQISKRLYALGNYSKFVRPGWVRVGTPEQAAIGVVASAFKNTTTHQFAIVLINTTFSSVPITVQLNGSTLSGAVQQWVTDSASDLVLRGDARVSGSNFASTLTPRSVTTFTGAGNN